MNNVATINSVLLKQNNLFKYYKLKGHETLFIYPNEASFYSFAMVMTEARPKHWNYYQISETMVKEGDVVVDCGSAEGFFTFACINKAKHVYVLEPLPLFEKSLNAMFKEKQNVTILPVAVGDKIGKSYFNIIDSESNLNATLNETKTNSSSIAIDVVTIDSLFADKGIKN